MTLNAKRTESPLSQFRGYAIANTLYVIDDSLSGRRIGDDPHAVVRERNSTHRYRSTLLGWWTGERDVFIAVHSYLNVDLTIGECIDLATDYLMEIGFFGSESELPDYVIR